MSLAQKTHITGVRRGKTGKVVAFNINRKIWGRGERGGKLLATKKHNGDEQINLCCLGIYGRACGLGVAKLKGLAMPHQINNLPEQMKWTVATDIEENIYDSSRTAYDLAGFNDDQYEEDANREASIIELFAQQGITVKFVGKG
jgi:hypothetical protein